MKAFGLDSHIVRVFVVIKRAINRMGNKLTSLSFHFGLVSVGLCP